jgi:hypothetical protein
MKNWQITGFLAILIIGFLFISGCTNNASPSITTSTPSPVITPVVTQLPPIPVQVTIPQNGVWIRVTYPGNYTGTYGTPGYYQTPVTDTGDHFYQILKAGNPVIASIKKIDGSGDLLKIAVYKDGVLFKEASTSAPYRLIEFYSDLKTPTPSAFTSSNPVTPVSTPQVTSQPTIPNLVGTWNVNAQGGVIQKSGVPGEWTHHTGSYSTLTGQAVVTDQKDRVLHGTFKAALGKEESFIAVIGMDNKNFYYVDQDGTNEGQIVSNGLINVVYRQVSANDSVIAVGTWTRVG